MNEKYNITKDYSVNRIGYGAMQLAGPGVMGFPKDVEGSIKLLNEAVKLGVNHIDTSDFYGPHTTNQLIKKALFPYKKDLLLVTKVGYLRGEDGSWIPSLESDQLKRAVEDNLTNLGLDKLEIVNLRVGGLDKMDSSSIEKPLKTLVKLKDEGIIKNLGLSNATKQQVDEFLDISPMVCVQNQYNLANRSDDFLIDYLNDKNIAYVPFFPLGGFSPLQSDKLNDISEKIGATPMQTALSWLLHRSPNILLIPGTTSLAHLCSNLAAGNLELSDEIIQELNSIA